MAGYHRGRRPHIHLGRVAKPNARPGNCVICRVEIPAGGGTLYRTDAGWGVIHREQSQGGWLMNPQPVTGGCPDATDKRNEELRANGFFGPDAPPHASEHDRIKLRAASWARANGGIQS